MNTNKNATIIFDNGGGIILQFEGKFAISTHDSKEAAEWYNDYIINGLDDWREGYNEVGILYFTPGDEDIRNGGYRIIDSDEIAEMIHSEVEVNSWYEEFINYLRKL